jgi:hypothetical protein
MIIEVNDPYKPITPDQAIKHELSTRYPLELNFALNNLIRIHLHYGSHGLAATIMVSEIKGELEKIMGSHIKCSTTHWVDLAIETYTKSGWTILSQLYDDPENGSYVFIPKR